MGLTPADADACLEAAVTAAAPPDVAQAGPSTLVLFSTFTLTVCRLSADGGGRSPRSFEKQDACTHVSLHRVPAHFH